jgi:hypothetical protein
MKPTMTHVTTLISALAAAGSFVSACQGEPSRQGAGGGSISGAGGGGISGAGGAGGESSSTGAPGGLESAWEGGACGQAVVRACAASLEQCGGDPGCARQLECLQQCPPPSRAPEASTCAAQCRPAPGSDAEAPYEQLARCVEQAERDACEQGGGAGEENRHPLLEQECPGSTETNACFQCEDTKCCQTYAACASDPACSAFNQCMKACTDPSLYACEVRCEGEHPGGLQKYAPRIACVTFRCGDQGQCSDEPRDDCARCIYGDKCARVAVECDIDPQCHLLSSCWATCATFDGDCQQACIDSHPEGKARFLESRECLAEACGIACLG